MNKVFFKKGFLKLLFFSIIIFIFSLSVFASDDPESLFFYNLSSQNMIKAYSGIADITSQTGFLLNPAMSSDIYKSNAGLSVSGFDNYFLINLLYQMPTDYGNLSFYFAYLYDSFLGESSLKNDIFLRINFSKLISEQLWVGFAVNFSSSISSNTNFGINSDIGFVYITENNPFEGFGFKNFKWGISLKNLGFPLTDSNRTVITPMGLAGGINFDFLSIKDILLLSNSTDIYLNYYPLGIGLLTGLNANLFNNYFLNIGFNIGTENATMNPANYLYFSAGGDFNIEDNTLKVSYSITPSFSTDGSLKHSINASYSFGKRDTTPPEVDIKTDKLKFSPNFDGNSDEINIYLNFKDDGLLYGWKVTIYDKDGNIVKEFIGQDVRQIKYITLKKIFERLFAKKEQVKVPEFVTWDGTDSKGNIVKDGIYYITAVAWDERNNIGKKEKFEVYVDNTITDVKYELSQNYGNIFSPNGDGNKDYLNIKINFPEITDDDTIKISIVDDENNVINEYKFTKKDIKDNILNFNWDGKDSNGNVAKEGVYNVLATVEDIAGNKKQIEIKDIKLVSHFEKVDTKADSLVFSPNNDGKLDTIVFKNEVDDLNGFLKWEAVIEDEYGNVVKRYNGEKTLPETIAWDGKDDKGKVIKDGNYKYKIKLFYDNGNEPVSNEITFKKDTEPTKVTIKPEYFSFSPNNDGKKDTITIEIESNEIDNVKEINLIDTKTNEKISKLNYKKVDDKIVIKWDGKDENGNELPAGKYIVDVNTEDEAKISKNYKSSPIKLVRELEKVFVDSDILYYSPNNDKRNDNITFKFDANNKDGLLNTEFYITDEKNEIVFKKEFKGLPDKFVFNKKLKDGKYYYYSIMNYDNGNSPKSFKKYFITDTVSAVAKVNIENKYFSPNKDGFKDNLILNYSFNEKVKDLYLKVLTNNKKEIETIKIDSENNKYSLSGSKLNDGKYILKLISYDYAGNEGVYESDFYINRVIPQFDIKIYTTLISPNDDNFKDNVKIDFSLDDSRIKNIDKFEKAIVEIYDQNGNKIFDKVFNSKPEYLYWYGKDLKHRALKDGKYMIKSRVYYLSGVNKYSKTYEIDVDNTPPKGTFVVKPTLFSPDNDGDNDKLYLSLNFSDYHNIESYKIEIYRKYSKNKLGSKPFKVYSGKINNKTKYFKQIIWDGIGDNKKLVDAASDYIAILTIKDVAGNEIKIKKDFYVDILVIKTALGYKIIISSIEFDFNSYKLKPQSKKILDRLIVILNKFKNYKIQIIGYTDSVGDEEYNLELSKKRAESVYKYLIQHDIDPARLTFTGMGEANPIDTNDTDEGRRRNRRVEFYLIK